MMAAVQRRKPNAVLVQFGIFAPGDRIIGNHADVLSKHVIHKSEGYEFFYYGKLFTVGEVDKMYKQHEDLFKMLSESTRLHTQRIPTT